MLGDITTARLSRGILLPAECVDTYLKNQAKYKIKSLFKSGIFCKSSESKSNRFSSGIFLSKSRN